ncbi:hypothetical protein ACJ41O_007409 [Fusarium nematophilum]
MSLPESVIRRAETGYDARDVMVITTSTLALYNSSELLALIFTTFKRRHGLYFWSLFLSTFGIIPYAIGWLFDYFDLLLNYVGMALNSVGWWLVVTGQSVVLYSRLHLVLDHELILRGVRWMIIVNGCVWHLTMTTLLFTITDGSSLTKGNQNPPLYNALEKVQLTFFCAQEFIISGLYLWKIVDILRTTFNRKRKFIWHLFACNVIIVVMDIALLVIMYRNNFVWEQGVKMVIYSIKLKLEFATLNRLVEFVQDRGGSDLSGSQHLSAFVEMSGSRSKKSQSSGNQPVLEGEGSRQTSERAVGGVDGEDSDESTGRMYDDALREMSRR